MTRVMAPTPPSDPEIARLVQRELGTPVLGLHTLRSGAWSSAIAVSTTSGEVVVRFAETPDDFRCDANASRFAGPQLPIPHVHGIGKSGEHWWCISDRMAGVHLDELSTTDLEQTLPSVAGMLIAMREIDSTGTFGYGGWDADGNGIFSSFADQLMDVVVDLPAERGGGWSKVLGECPYEQSEFDEGMKELERLCAYVPNVRQLIHEDTINFNVTVQRNGVSGIFDWGCAMWGDALYDLAWFRFWNPWYPQWSQLNVPDRLESLVGTYGDNVEERMHCYLLHIGLMHIRYNAFIGDRVGMRDIAHATAKLLRNEP